MSKAKSIFQKMSAIVVIIYFFRLFLIKTEAIEMMKVCCRNIYDFSSYLIMPIKFTQGINFWNITLFILIFLLVINLGKWIMFDELERDEKKEKEEIEKIVQE